jgi:hypothetical protein
MPLLANGRDYTLGTILSLRGKRFKAGVVFGVAGFIERDPRLGAVDRHSQLQTLARWGSRSETDGDAVSRVPITDN